MSDKPVYTEFADHVISENPYVRILGNVSWSDEFDSYTALAQVGGSLGIVAVNLVQQETTPQPIEHKQ